MRCRGRAQEIVTGYSGPFSSFSEWHAFGIGFYYGARTEYSTLPADLSNPDANRYNEDVDAEFHYATLGFEAGDLYRRHRGKAAAGSGVVAAIGALLASGVV